MLSMLLSGCNTSGASGDAAAEPSSFTSAITEEIQPTPASETDDSPVSAAEEAAQPQSADMSPLVIDEPIDLSASIGCHGNLLYIGDTYYTMTDSGPEPVELQSLDTTVELYGTWDLNLDYAVIDGELVFRDRNVPFGPYAIIDGERVSQADYYEQFPPFEIPEDDSIEWITPIAATVSPVEGSTDTVMLTIRRSEKSIVESCRYPFFYNLTTGEITDPLSNVPELFDHGNVSIVQFNSSLTRALVHVFGVDTLETGENAVGDGRSYVCNLSTGEMQLVTDLLESHLPEPEADDTRWYENGGGPLWADDDTLLFWEIEIFPNGKEEGITPDGQLIDPWDRHPWLFSYNVATGELNYRLRDVEMYTGIPNYNQLYLHNFSSYDDGCEFQILDAASGAVQTLSGPTFQELSGNHWSESATQTILRADDGTIYLVDDTQMAWAKLSDHMALPSEEITAVQQVTDRWFYLLTEEQAYFYQIPDNLEWTPLT